MNIVEMLKQKKAQGLSINVIIVAAIALIVLVVLIAIFTGRISLFGEGLDSTTRGSYCTDAAATAANSDNSQGGSWLESCPDNQRQAIGFFADADDNQGRVCCVDRADT